MKTKRRVIQPKRDGSFVDRRWYAYALAGAGAVVGATPAHASIVFTSANTTINATCGSGQCFSSLLSVDLDADGNNDFTLQAEVSSSAAILHFTGTGPTPAGAYRNGGTLATPLLTNGTSIGPAAVGFSYVPGAHVLNPSSVWGPTSGDGYLALEFHLSTDPNPGDVNYAWAELGLAFNGTSSYSVTLEGYAYESDPNTPILAGATGGTGGGGGGGGVPEPGTAGLALLALGAGGLGAWRRRKQAQQAA